MIENNKGEKFEKVKAGITDDGNDNYIYQKAPEWITPTILRFNNGKTVSIDPNEGCFEVYNPNKFSIYYVNIHHHMDRRIHSPQQIIVAPDKFAFIPHRYYMIYSHFIGNKEGVFTVVENMGEQMFKGNKKVSRPDKKKQYF